MSSRYDYYNTGDDTTWGIYGIFWTAQTFTATAAYLCTSAKLKLLRQGSPGTITVSIRGVSGGVPSGGDLCSGTTNGNTLTTDSGGEWREITLGDGVSIASGTQYAIVVRAIDAPNSSNRLKLRTDYNPSEYAGGQLADSSDSGVNWSGDEYGDHVFEVWGEELAVAGGIAAPSVTELLLVGAL